MTRLYNTCVSYKKDPLPALVDREQELAALNAQLAGSSSRRQSAFILLYGRRRVGKSTLLKAWAAGSGLPYTYWAADKDLAEVQRRRFYDRFSQTQSPGESRFGSWSAVFEQIALVVGDKRHILILDEVTYAAQSDPNFYVALQHAWDQHFLHSHVILVLCGSHVRMMSQLFGEGHPLFGRFTLPLYLEPLAFAHLRKFFPRWSAEERVAAYAMVGGIPEYYEWLEPSLSLRDNLRQRVIQKPSPFLTEARFLLYDNLEQPAAHLSVIRAIGEGRHTFDAIRLASEGASHKLTPYLDRLRDLRLIERTVSALIRPQKRKDSKNSRWVLSDPFLRFYFRFVAPALEVEPYDAGELTDLIWGQLRAFVGQTAFEEICRDWVRQASLSKGVLPFRPTTVGRHWSKTVETDVVGIHWETRQILIGECKWDDSPVSREQVRRLVDVTAPQTLTDLARQAGGGEDEIRHWQVHLAFFSRKGFTPDAQRYLKISDILAVDLKRIDADLR